jgi:hypothetical protein
MVLNAELLNTELEAYVPIQEASERQSQARTCCLLPFPLIFVSSLVRVMLSTYTFQKLSRIIQSLFLLGS